MAETLTYSVLKKRLQIANCCAGKKGQAILAKQKKGVDCTTHLKEVKLILNLVDAIKPYACVIASETAFTSYSTAGWTGGSATFSLTITFNGFTVGGFGTRVAAGQSTITAAMTALVSAINAAQGSTISYFYSNTFIMFAPTAGEDGNDYTVTFSATGGGSPTIPTPTGTFSGGVDGNEDDEFDDTDKCLTIENVQTILDKLCMLCPGPATSYVRFRTT